jgi:Ulp1 family protease
MEIKKNASSQKLAQQKVRRWAERTDIYPFDFKFKPIEINWADI